MLNLAATREALDRFTAELPQAGLEPERVRSLATTVRAQIAQALSTPEADTPWIDHNLAVVVATAFEHAGLREAGSRLFFSVRRRIAAALERDPDDLIQALALAQGIPDHLQDPRLVDDVRLLVDAVGRPHAGPRLVSAAVQTVVAAERSNEGEVVKALRSGATAIKDAAERLRARLGHHPDLPLDLAELELALATEAEGDARHAALDRVRGLLKDHLERFGATSATRRLQAKALALRARGQGAALDVRQEAMAILEDEMREGSLQPQTAQQLVRTLERAQALDKPTAARIAEIVDRAAGLDPAAWRKVRSVLLEHAGDQSALVTLWEQSLREDPKHAEAARGLAGRLLENLRAGLAAPFESDVLERVLDAVPFQTLARWSADDVDLVVGLARTTFGTARAARFFRERLTQTRELRGRPAFWQKVLAIHEELGDQDLLLEAAREALRHTDHPSARLLVARILLAQEKDLEEAAHVLKPLLDVRGETGADAHGLRQQIAAHPSLKDSRRGALLAFEDRIGVGTGTPFKLRVVFVAKGYLLAEAVEAQAPDFYEHRHLRTMIRAEDLPRGVSPLDLRKGDTLEAPLRGQDADASRDRDGLRMYWVADSSALRVGLDAARLERRWAEEEEALGIGPGVPIALKVRHDGRRGLEGRLLLSGGREYPLRPEIAPEQLPDGVDPTKLGKGKRLYGVVVAEQAAQGRTCRVVGRLQIEPPPGAPAETPAELEGEAAEPPPPSQAASLEGAAE
jgi:hypothetical protein